MIKSKDSFEYWKNIRKYAKYAWIPRDINNKAGQYIVDFILRLE